MVSVINKSMFAAVLTFAVCFIAMGAVAQHEHAAFVKSNEICKQLGAKLAETYDDDRNATVDFAKLRIQLTTAQMDAKELAAERDSYEAQCKAMQSMLHMSRRALREWQREHGEEFGEPVGEVVPERAQ